jgi:hypothetical protein
MVPRGLDLKLFVCFFDPATSEASESSKQQYSISIPTLLTSAKGKARFSSKYGRALGYTVLESNLDQMHANTEACQLIITIYIIVFLLEDCCAWQMQGFDSPLRQSGKPGVANSVSVFSSEQGEVTLMFIQCSKLLLT